VNNNKKNDNNSIFKYQQEIFQLLQENKIINNDDNIHPTETINNVIKTFCRIDRGIKIKITIQNQVSYNLQVFFFNLI
jgi:hypothetical protein